MTHPPNRRRSSALLPRRRPGDAMTSPPLLRSYPRLGDRRYADGSAAHADWAKAVAVQILSEFRQLLLFGQERVRKTVVLAGGVSPRKPSTLATLQLDRTLDAV